MSKRMGPSSGVNTCPSICTLLTFNTLRATLPRPCTRFNSPGAWTERANFALYSVFFPFTRGVSAALGAIASLSLMSPFESSTKTTPSASGGSKVSSATSSGDSDLFCNGCSRLVGEVDLCEFAMTTSESAPFWGCKLSIRF